jgi:CDP-4-dehydro-6-deoxyglucose reductase
MALQPWRTGIVTQIIDETPNTKRYRIKIPELESFDFKPGQFITFDLPIDEKPSRRLRSYSIASWPDGSNELELVIVLNESGAGTPWLFQNVKEGTELTLRGPQGVFTLPETIDTDIFFICTGTGIAPFRSMSHYIHNHNIPHKNIYLIFGTRKKPDLLYYEELKQLEAAFPGFHFIPTLSREQWEGRSGYVHPVYEELLSNRPEAKFFLCGWKAMLDETKKRITEMGYDKKSIHQEVYG